jgi:hypothetical protein
MRLARPKCHAAPQHRCIAGQVRCGWRAATGSRPPQRCGVKSAVRMQRIRGQTLHIGGANSVKGETIPILREVEVRPTSDGELGAAAV